MTREDAVSITCRLVALYFLCWTALNLSFLPQSIMAYWSVRQYSMRSAGLVPGGGHNEWMQMVSLVLALLRIVAGLALGVWFFKGGAKVRDFFLPAGSSEAQS
jgi:hypothetical protein